MNYKATPDWAISFIASFVYLLSLVALGYSFVYLGLSPSLAIPVFLGIILSVAGGFMSSVANAVMLAILTVYLFGGDEWRLFWNLLLNTIIFLGAGWLATSRRNEARRADVNYAKAKLVDNANGNIERVWKLADEIKFADDNWGTKTGYDSLMHAKKIADDLALMVKGWHTLAMEKHLVIKDDEASNDEARQG